MNILFYYKFYPNIGGVETVITILANEFAKKGHKVGIISYNQDWNVSIELDKQITLYSLPNTDKLICEKNIKELARLIQKEKYQILFNHDSVYDSIEFVSKVKKEAVCKLVTLHHGAIYLSKQGFLSTLKESNSSFKRFLSRFASIAYLLKNVKTFLHHQKNINKCDKYVCLSDAYRAQLYRPNKTFVIYNPLSYVDFLEEDEYKYKENIVLFVGRVSNWVKRITIMLYIWKNIDTTGWKFYLVGEGPDRVFIQDYISSNNISNVVVLGYKRPRLFYKKSKIFLMTSSTEGYPMTLSEAKQYGCVPIAMNSFESIGECIDNGNDGFIVNNNDVKDFSEKLIALMNESTILEKMAHKAVENSKSKTASLISEQWIELFNSII